jgi:cyclic dehypoxanthinyl futalosine synthase
MHTSTHSDRLSPEEAVRLLGEADLHDLAARADALARRLHPEPWRTFAIDRNINFTNICVCRCLFCAFWRDPGDPEAYVLSDEAIEAKVREAVALGATHVLMQGGIHPGLGLAWYERMLRRLRERFPAVAIHALSPPEVRALAERERLPVETVLGRLREAGLSSLPGGGAEVLADRARRLISPRKGTAQDWLDVMRAAHRLGMPTSATMVFGHVERPEERIEHLRLLRDLQDETGGFQSFIAWPFLAARTRLAASGLLPPAWQPVTGVEYLRMVAVARLFLENVPNVQASHVTMGPKIAQVALGFGANDLGSTMIEENVVSAARPAEDAGGRAEGPAPEGPEGAAGTLTPEALRRLIREAGFEPRQRDCYYRIVGP